MKISKLSLDCLHHKLSEAEAQLRWREHDLHGYGSKILKGKQEREHITFFVSFSALEKVEFGFGHSLSPQKFDLQLDTDEDLH